jgi:PAS domain S-box-containing protein
MTPPETLSPLRILLVEDDENDRVAFRRALQKGQLPCEITECVRAEEALESLQAGPGQFDLVVIDYRLPGISGLHFCKTLLEQGIPLPLVLLTGQGSQQLAVDALKIGVEDYIVKDVDYDYLGLLPVVLRQAVAKHSDRTARKKAEEELRVAYDELERRVDERTASLAKTAVQLELELTERRRAEESLRLSEERFRSVAETAAEAIILMDSSGKIVFWNAAAVLIFGYTRDEANGRPVTLIMPDRFREGHSGAIREMISTSRLNVPGNAIERIGLRKDGTEFPMELALATWETKEGVFFTGIMRDLTRRKETEEEIRHLSRRLIIVIEEERKRLAMDLHDELGQALTSLHYYLETLHVSSSDEKGEQEAILEKSMTLVRKLGEDIRNIASELRPPMLDHLGLIPTLHWYVSDFCERMKGLEVDFQAIGIKERPDPGIEIILYRLLQEALNNVVKHSSAKHVGIKLTCSHPTLILSIRDDGIGFEQESAPNQGGRLPGIGILGMKERVGSVGGTIDIRSKKGEGSVMRVELPMFLGETEKKNEDSDSR